MEFWLIFHLLIGTLICFDLFFMRANGSHMDWKWSLGLSIFYISVAFIFNGWIYYSYGFEKGLAFTTGYLIEKALSVDNLFVFAMIFTFLNISIENQHKVLLYGIVGAILMRAILIYSGVELIENLKWTEWIFGGLLLFTSYKMFFFNQDTDTIEHSFLYKKLVSSGYFTKNLPSPHFFTWENGKRLGTPMLLAVLMVESADLIFAVDSIPAILAITNDFFIVYTSNIFAILGLRALYFLLAGALNKLHYLKYGLATLLGFIGIKLLLNAYYGAKVIPIEFALLFTVLCIGISIYYSLRKSKEMAP